MDGFRFDAWTRRRFGIVTAGAVAGILGLGLHDDAPAKRKKKKRKKKHKTKCEKHRTPCNPKTDRQLCCGGLYCLNVPELGGNHCCRPRFDACEQNSDCCGNTICVGGFCDIE